MLVARAVSRFSRLAPRVARLSTSSEPSDRLEAAFADYESGKLAAAVEGFAGAAEAGSAEGNFWLGLSYDGLIGRNAAGELPVEKDPAAAARCYRRAADAGHAEAMFNMAMCHRDGDGVEVDVLAGYDWLVRGAEAGSMRAQFNAALALDPNHPPYGKPGETPVVPKDAAAAVDLYRMAVEQGHGKAMVNLGVALYTGTGVARDADAARELWEEADELGITEAGRCLRNAESGQWDMLGPPDVPGSQA